MKKYSTLLLYCCFLLFSNNTFTQSSIQRIEPPNWWAGMAHPELQLLVYGKDIGHLEPSINYPGVHIQHCIRVENNNYLFINLTLAADVKAGTFDIQFSDKGKNILTQKYTLLPREAGSAQREGFNQKDVLYLITPDRFANGNTGNDNVSTLLETANRSFEGGRHGGDIEGITAHLDYIHDMGYTAIWLNPILENNMQTYSYHGYSTTDYYKIDPRYGSNEAYLAMSKKAKSMGIKMIMDMIVNHCGLEHWWMKDLPCADQQPGRPLHGKQSSQDYFAGPACGSGG
jgi:neopullulanase